VVQVPAPLMASVPDRELRAVLAHEMAHAQHDARRLWWLELASQASLSGSGLLTLFLDYPGMERAADQKSLPPRTRRIQKRLANPQLMLW
jgi:beta-lactamase regulating signal transducer with metallopeptidase domain